MASGSRNFQDILNIFEYVILKDIAPNILKGENWISKIVVPGGKIAIVILLHRIRDLLML